MADPVFFASQAAWRDWLAENHDTAEPMWVGLQRVGSGDAGLNYKQALDEALCFGWIDGQRRGIDHNTWMIRFSKRQPGSIWSQINLRHVERLTKAGRMDAAGLAAHDGRDLRKQRLYSSENPPAELDPALEREFKANRKAWANFETMPPYYQRTAKFWVMSAKKAETKERRLKALIADSAAGRKVGPLRRPGEE